MDSNQKNPYEAGKEADGMFHPDYDLTVSQPELNPPKTGVPPHAAECIDAYRNTGGDTDVQGSYTGIYRDRVLRSEGAFRAFDSSVLGEIDGYFEPVQDADDL